jgi:hypothetical protein
MYYKIKFMHSYMFGNVPHPFLSCIKQIENEYIEMQTIYMSPHTVLNYIKECL